MIEAGKLRHRITFQQRNSEKNRRGQRGDNWTDVADASAQITEMNGSEREQARQLVARATHRVMVRHRRQFEITTKLRFLFRGRQFEIGHVGNVDQVNGLLPLTCIEMKP